jgi:hypothetical protein
MATIDITEQALGTQSATLKIDYLEKHELLKTNIL